MRKTAVTVATALAWICVAFLMEPVFPLGDWRWGVIAIGLLLFIPAMYAREIAQAFGRLRKVRLRRASRRTSTVPSPAIPVRIDPEQSEFSHRPWGSQVSVFMTAESSLDVAARFKSFALDIEMSDGTLECPFAQFQRDRDAKEFRIPTDIEIPPRNQVSGWVHFLYLGELRVSDFQRFRFRVRVIGETEQEFNFEPYDWTDARKGQSTLVETGGA